MFPLTPSTQKLAAALSLLLRSFSIGQKPVLGNFQPIRLRAQRTCRALSTPKSALIFCWTAWALILLVGHCQIIDCNKDIEIKEKH